MKKLYLILFLSLFVRFDICGQWQYLNSGTGRALLSLDVLNPDTLFVAGDSGLVIKSFDGGLSWMDVSYIGNNRIVSLSFLNHLSGYALTFEGTVIHTVDGGNTWNIIYNSLPGQTGTEIKSTNDSCIVVTGYYTSGNLLRSCDNGQTWVIDSLANFSLQTAASIDLVNDSSWIVLTRFADIFMTNNRGYSWQNIHSGSDGGSSIQAVNDSIFMAIGCEPNCVFCFNSSFDAGSTWISATNLKGEDLYFFSNGIGHIIRGCGGAGYIISYSQDFGNTYVDTYNSNSFDTLLTSIEFASLNIGFATGTNGVILKTVTGGTSDISEIPKTEIKIYPNPFNDQIHFSSKVNCDVIILDQLQRIVKQQTINDEGLVNTFDLPDGIYFYFLKEDDQIKQSGKIIKQSSK